MPKRAIIRQNESTAVQNRNDDPKAIYLRQREEEIIIRKKELAVSKQRNLLMFSCLTVFVMLFGVLSFGSYYVFTQTSIIDRLDESLNLQQTIVALEQGAGNPSNTNGTINATQSPTMLPTTTPPIFPTIPTNNGAIPSVVPPSVGAQPTTIPQAPNLSGTVLIDGDFSSGINETIWDFNLNQWTLVGQTLRSGAPYSWLVARDLTFQNYTYEVWLGSNSDANGNYMYMNQRILIGMNMSQAAGTLLWLRINDEMGYGQLISTTTSTFKNNSSHQQLPNTTFDERISPMDHSDGLYVRADVLQNRFVIFIEGQEMLDVTPMNAPRNGTIGLSIPAGVDLLRLRLTQRQ